MKIFGRKFWELKITAVAVALAVGLLFAVVGPTPAASAHQGADDGDILCATSGERTVKGHVHQSFIVIEEYNAEDIRFNLNDGAICAYFRTSKVQTPNDFVSENQYTLGGICGKAKTNCDGMKALKISDIGDKGCIMDDRQVLPGCREDYRRS